MHIKKISKNKEPFIKITFRSMKELKGYRDGIRNTCNTVKYSLQGTTQGRYLTGGVPPVRFSM